MKKPALLLFLALSACADPDVVVRPDIVNVPVPVACHIAPVPMPPWATAKITPKSTLTDMVRALVVEREQRLGYEGQLQAAIKSCQ